MNLQFKVHAKIQKPIAEVFDAVYNPKKLSAYFTTAGASAPLEEGQTVMWDFADFPGAFPVKVKRMVPNEKIEIAWQAADGDYETLVVFDFKALEPQNTLVEVQESGWKESPEGLKNSYSNCMGWMQMLCCLKAYLEHGINLREGMF